jgi:Leucine-rich repeat (LRR) protein
VVTALSAAPLRSALLLLVMTATCVSSLIPVAAAAPDQVPPPPPPWPAHPATDMAARVTLAALGAVATGLSTEPGAAAVRQAVAELLRDRRQLQRLLSEPRVAEVVTMELEANGPQQSMAAVINWSAPDRRLMWRSAPMEGGDMQQRPHPGPGGATPSTRPRPTAVVDPPAHRYLQEPVLAACPSPPQVLQAGATRAVLDFTGGYAPHSACGWQLQCVSKGETLLVNFTDFNTEGGYDYVSIYDGSSDNSPSIGRPDRLSGPTVAALSTAGYGSSNGTMLLTFSSNSNSEGRGFAAEYWCEKTGRARLGCTNPHATNYHLASEFQSSCVLPPPQLCLETASLRAGFVVEADEVAQEAWAQLRGWGSSKSDPCGVDWRGGWQGVSCIAGRVTGVSFHGASSLQFRLLGSALAQLTELETLDMYRTGLRGTVPMELGRLAKLQQLYLCHTVVSGTVPTSFGRLTELQVLWAQDTLLSGTVPGVLSELTQLQTLVIYSTSVSGTVPAELGELAQLQTLYLYSMPVSGTVPADLGKLTQLQKLDFDASSLSGTVPAELGNVMQLQRLEMYSTSVSGTVPAELGGLTQLQRLYLDSTSVSGTVPVELGELTQLQRLYLDSTSMSGTVPVELGELTQLQQLYLFSTSVSGTVSPELGGLVQLQELLLHTTSVSGTVPAALGRLTQSQKLWMHSTSVSGTLPTEIGGLAKLQSLRLDSTFLGGTPPSFADCVQLEHLDLGDCFFTGLPLALPSTLTHLYLGSNPIDASTTELHSLLGPLDRLLSVLEVGLVRSDIPLDVAPRHSCDLHHPCGPRLFTPTGCTVGGACAFRLDLYDEADAPLRVGGLAANLTLRLGTNLRIFEMVDMGNGSFLAPVPRTWIARTGSYTFSFFNADREFQPFISTTQTIVDNSTTLRTVNFGPRICTGVHTVADAATGSVCGCITGFAPDPRPPNSSAPLSCHSSCANGRAVTRDGTSCQCPGSSYDVARTGVLLCAATAWAPPEGIVEYQQAHAAWAQGSMCHHCPDECATCAHGVATLQQGWRLAEASTAALQQLIANGSADAAPRVALRCPSAAYGRPACPSMRLDVGATADNLTCLRNHTGWLCAQCVSGFSHKASDNSCTRCADATTIKNSFGISGWSLLVLVALVVALAVFAFKLLQRAKSSHYLQQVKKELNTSVKIVLGLLQVLSLLKDSLSLVYPPEPAHAMSYAALFTADLRSLVKLDCAGWNWFERWTLLVVVVPLLAFVVVGLRCLYHRHAHGAAHARAQAVNALFFVVMLMYPQVSQRSLSALNCRQISASVTVLEADYSVDCDSVEYGFTRVLALVLVAIWPLGIPLGLAWLLRHEWRKSQKLWQFTDLADGEGSLSTTSGELAHPELSRATSDHRLGPVDEDSTLTSFHAERIEATFAFCTASYRPECFWFEPVDMLRKLILSGLLQFVRRGSAEQVLVGCTLAFASFGLQQRVQPCKF